MGLFDLFKKPVIAPVERFEDDVLGPMVWSKDDEAWRWEHGGVRYLIAYDYQATPSSATLTYARMILSDPELFGRAIERAKKDAVNEFPWLAEEIAGLRVATVRFCKPMSMLVDLEGGKEGRYWCVEFGEEGCYGLGF